jgi:hypothetical protein
MSLILIAWMAQPLRAHSRSAAERNLEVPTAAAAVAADAQVAVKDRFELLFN